MVSRPGSNQVSPAMSNKWRVSAAAMNQTVTNMDTRAQEREQNQLQLPVVRKSQIRRNTGARDSKAQFARRSSETSIMASQVLS